MSRLVNLVIAAALIAGAWFLGVPMYKQYQQTGEVTIPFIDKTLNLKDLSLDSLGTGSSNSGASVPTQLTAAEALTKLNALPVKGKAPMTGYDRVGKFGAAWTDKATGVAYAGNGCDTRNDILDRDLKNKTYTKISSCPNAVATGVLDDPYTGTTIDFTRGAASSKVQIDHIIPLGNAWVTGAQQWNQDKRIAFANDPSNLLAVDGPSNGAKSDRDASGWLPSNKAVRCSYIAAQVNVKSTYGLWVTSAEKNAMTQILAKC